MGLTLTRKPGEGIFIGEYIDIEVVRVRGNKVSLRINAPPEIRILRNELEDWYPENEVEYPTEP